jgi:hypothetical protein
VLGDAGVSFGARDDVPVVIQRRIDAALATVNQFLRLRQAPRIGGIYLLLEFWFYHIQTLTHKLHKKTKLSVDTNAHLATIRHMKRDKPKGGSLIPVSERAIFVRINRQLAKENQRLLRIRARMRKRFGAAYALVHENGEVVDRFDDIETAGRRLNVLKPYECAE